jgi:hypothetical protein
LLLLLQAQGFLAWLRRLGASHGQRPQAEQGNAQVPGTTQVSG